MAVSRPAFSVSNILSSPKLYRLIVHKDFQRQTHSEANFLASGAMPVLIASLLLQGHKDWPGFTVFFLYVGVGLILQQRILYEVLC